MTVMLSVKVSTKHQIVVPSQARRALGIEPGDRLAVEIRAGSIVLTPRPPRASQRLRGLGSAAWQGVDPVEYVRRLRREWDRPGLR
jgi:AbrB family looped-hinge helix DNA binding protein